MQKTLPTIAGASILWAGWTSGPVPALDVAELVARADVVVAARAADPVYLRRTVVSLEGGEVVAGRLMQTTLSVEHVLKGDQGSSVVVEFILPDRLIGYRGVAAGRYAVYFLTRTRDAIVFTNPYHPSVIAAPGSVASADSPLEHVAAAIGAVLGRPGVTRDERLQAVDALRFTHVSGAVRALRTQLVESDIEIRLAAAAALVEANDASAFDIVETALLADRATIPAHLKWNLQAAIELRLKTPEAVPLLNRLMASPEDRTRRVASRALSQVKTLAAVGPLALALYDADHEVRYNAVIGLAEYTGQGEWRPSIPEFQTNEDRYLRYWREWARGRR